jgi:hypothetical protein
LAPFGQAVSEEKTFLILANQNQELALVAIFVGGTERNGETLLRTLHRCLMPSLVPFGQVVSEEKIKVKIYMPCNFEVNLITPLGVIGLFSSFFLAHLAM